MPRQTDRREFLQAAHTYKPGKSRVGGWYVSEKLDGSRCFWDGGISRGLPTVSVPYAGIIDPKSPTKELKKKIKPFATGLWSRYGNPIIAPDWFLDSLPAVPLDGELWAGRGNFQTCRSITSGDTWDDRWQDIQFAVYGVPSLHQVFRDGEIKNQNMVLTMRKAEVFDWMSGLKRKELEKQFLMEDGSTFEHEIVAAGNLLNNNGRVFLHPQRKLPEDHDEAAAEIERTLDSILDLGGEGLVLRQPGSLWQPRRMNHLLKFKPFEDAEATVIGFVSGRPGKQGNVLGKIGALVVRWESVEFEIGTGMTMKAREFARPEDVEFAKANPETRMPDGAVGTHFKVGDTITFLFRETSDENVPKEARYWRHRDAE